MRKEEVGEVNMFKEGPLRFSFPHPIKFGLVTLVAHVTCVLTVTRHKCRVRRKNIQI